MVGGYAGSPSQVAARGEEGGKDTSWVAVGGGREGEERKWEAREFEIAFVYRLTLGCSKGKWCWACLTFPMGPGPQRRTCCALGS